MGFDLRWRTLSLCEPDFGRVRFESESSLPFLCSGASGTCCRRAADRVVGPE